ncbi:hypothetical protein HAX54_004792, partial [Datura stramonium]|nr:hypothetical protein [Datura stramonium]
MHSHGNIPQSNYHSNYSAADHNVGTSYGGSYGSAIGESYSRGPDEFTNLDLGLKYNKEQYGKILEMLNKDAGQNRDSSQISQENHTISANAT